MKPIIFSTQMVKAILDGTKTMTRRVVKPKYKDDEEGFTVNTNVSTGVKWLEKHDEDEMSFDPPRYINPKYNVGDVLWVRETWQCVGKRDQSMELRIINKIDHKVRHAKFTNRERYNKCIKRMGEWRPSIFLQREAARIFLKVKSVRVEKLQDINEADAIKEGSYLDRCECKPYKNDKTAFNKLFVEKWCHIHGAEFKDLWDSYNAKRGYSWETNPWVWVYEFERINKEEI